MPRLALGVSHEVPSDPGFPALLLRAPCRRFRDDQQQPQTSKPPKITKQTRMELIRLVNAELVYVRSPFPMGRDGLKLRDGVVTPSGAELAANGSDVGTGCEEWRRRPHHRCRFQRQL